MARKILFVSCLGLALAAAGCNSDEEPTGPEGGSGAGATAVADDPAVAEAKAAVRQFMEAAQKGDVTAVKSLYAHDVKIDPDEVKPRNMTFEVRDGWLQDPTTALVETYLVDPDVQEARKEFIVTYQLKLSDGRWKIADETVYLCRADGCGVGGAGDGVRPGG